VLHVLGSAQGRHVITNNQTLKDKFFYGDTVELQGDSAMLPVVSKHPPAMCDQASPLESDKEWVLEGRTQQEYRDMAQKVLNSAYYNASGRQKLSYRKVKSGEAVVHGLPESFGGKLEHPSNYGISKLKELIKAKQAIYISMKNERLILAKRKGPKPSSFKRKMNPNLKCAHRTSKYMKNQMPERSPPTSAAASGHQLENIGSLAIGSDIASLEHEEAIIKNNDPANGDTITSTTDIEIIENQMSPGCELADHEEDSTTNETRLLSNRPTKLCSRTNIVPMSGTSNPPLCSIDRRNCNRQTSAMPDSNTELCGRTNIVPMSGTSNPPLCFIDRSSYNRQTSAIPHIGMIQGLMEEMRQLKSRISVLETSSAKRNFKEHEEQDDEEEEDRKGTKKQKTNN